MKNFLLFLAILFSTSVYTQNSASIMHYNLLFYGQTSFWCTSTNNPVPSKDSALRTIINYSLPDVFTVNELGSEVFGQNILNNVLNINGRSNYVMGSYSGGSNLNNLLFYNSNKFTEYSHSTISVSPRNVDIYTLYYNSFSSNQDTAFLHILVAHFKAGTGSSDETERANAAEAVMEHLQNNYSAGNFLIAGDFNLYGASEIAYQTLINYSNPAYSFNDPIDQEGEWHEDSNFALYHTQCPQGGNSDSCYAGGGMDDRFDFILASNNIISGSDGIKYISNTYKAFGNDGTNYNWDINTSGNLVVPDSVAEALYKMSDHLPVIMELEFDLNQVGIASREKLNGLSVKLANPVNETATIFIDQNKATTVEIELLDISGRLIRTTWERLSRGKLSLNTADLNSGFYLVRIRPENSSEEKTLKLIKQ